MSVHCLEIDSRSDIARGETRLMKLIEYKEVRENLKGLLRRIERCLKCYDRFRIHRG